MSTATLRLEFACRFGTALASCILTFPPYSYAFEPYVQALPAKTGIIGALGLVAPRPMLSGRPGDVGLIACLRIPGRSLGTADIVRFFEQYLGPRLNAFPGPRSIVLLDNAPTLAHKERYQI